MKRRALLAAPAAALAGCAWPDPRRAEPATEAALLAAMKSRPLVLLGEVHDNAEQHALRRRAFAGLLAGGARPALLMEQFDIEHQAAIDERLRTGAADAQAVVDAGQGGRGWNWAFYRPFVALAIEHRLPIVAANVSRAAARSVMSEGLAARGFDPQVPEALLQAQVAAVVAGHCNAIDANAARPLALAQVARDQAMARLVVRHGGNGAVLLAGNGHVRNDIGAPAWLGPAHRARAVTIGLVEATGDSRAGATPPGDAAIRRAPFDQVFSTAPPSRPDPCAAFRR